MAQPSLARVRSIEHGGLRAATRPFTAPIFAGMDLDDSSIRLLKYQRIRYIRYVIEKSPVRRTSLIGQPFPKTLKQLALKHTTPCTEDIETELKWQAVSFLAFARQLDEWLSCKEEFEHAFLIGESSRATDALASARKKCGLSLWDIESQFLLASQVGGLEENRRVLHEIGSSAPNWIKLFLPFLGLRAEPDFSVAEYHAQLDPLLTPENDAPDDLKAIFDDARFRLNPSRGSTATLERVLNVEESHALIDRFIAWVRAVECLYVRSFNAIEGNAPTYVRVLNNEMHSHRLEFLAGIQDVGHGIADAYMCRIFDVLDAYTKGDYSEAARESLTLLAERPTVLEPYELAAKSALFLHSSPVSPFSPSSVASEILTSMTDVLSRNERVSTSLEKLQVLSYQLDSFGIGPQLRAFHDTHARDSAVLRLSAETGVFSTIPTPRTYLALCGSENAIPHLESLSELQPDNSAVRLFLSSQESIRDGTVSELPVTIPSSRAMRHQAYVLESLGKHEEALDTYKQLHRSSLCATELSDVTAGQYRCYTALSDRTRAARLIVESALQSPQIVSRDTLESLLSQYPDGGDSVVSRDIAWPILFAIAQLHEHRARDTRELHDVLEDFLSAWEVQRPSQLLSAESEFRHEELVYLLREVCVPPILVESIWFDSQDELMQERLRLCTWLSSADSPRRTEYQDEIADLSRAAAIMELTHKAERSRIYVDTEGIARNLPKTTVDRAHRCLALGKLREEKLRKTLEVTGLLFDGLDDNKVFLIDEGYRLFCSVFADIKTSFVSSNQYGLDANLSQRIRHGTLAGALRATFEDLHLVTHKGANGRYIRNDEWLGRLTRDDEVLAPRLHESIADFSQEIDNIISEVRNEWIQVRVDGRPQFALFDFEFDELELHSVYEQCIVCEEPAQLTEQVFVALWERTEDALAKVRTAIQDELKERLFAAIDTCERSVDAIVGHDASGPIRTAFTSCRTQLTLALSAIAEWFRLDEQQRIPNCDVRSVVEAVLGVVQRFSGPTELRYNLSVVNDISVPGKAFRPMWDILFILLDNAAKHSRIDITNVNIDVEMDGESVVVRVENPLCEQIDLDQLSTTVDKLNSLTADEDDLASSRTEGGSGYSKLHKIIRYEMGIDKYGVAVSASSDSYVANITMDVPWSRE